MSETPPAYGPSKTCRLCGSSSTHTPLPDLKWAAVVAGKIVAVFEDESDALRYATKYGGFKREIEVVEDAP